MLSQEKNKHTQTKQNKQTKTEENNMNPRFIFDFWRITHVLQDVMETQISSFVYTSTIIE